MRLIGTSTYYLRKLSTSLLLASLVALGATSVQAQERDPDLGSPTAKNQKATSNSEVIDALGLEESDVASLDFGSSDPTGYTTFSESAAEFPQKGDSYLTLSSGCAGAALDPDDEGNFSCDLGGLTGPGGATDMVQMKLELNVPEGATSVLFDFKYLSEEFPEFVGSEFNDGFVVEVGESTFTVDGNELEAPDNVAFDDKGNPITVNTVFGVSEDESSGTTYDGGTDRLTTEVPVSSDASSITLIFSIFDVSDEFYDSTVFLEDIRFEQPQRNLALKGLEVTQAVQNWQNDVPLIQGKPTWVRAHLVDKGEETEETRVPNLIFEGKIGGENFTLTTSSEPPIEREIPLEKDIGVNELRASWGKTVNYRLPNNWDEGEPVTIELDGLGNDIECPETAPANEEGNCEVEVEFQDVPTPELEVVRYVWEDTNGNMHEPSLSKGEIEEEIEEVISKYPVEDIDYNIVEENFPGGQRQNAPTGSDVNEALEDRAESQDGWSGFSEDGLENQTLYYGFVDSDYIGLAFAYFGGFVFNSYEGGLVGSQGSGATNVDATAGHELGHVLARPHAVNEADNGTNSSGEKLGYCGSDAVSFVDDFPYSRDSGDSDGDDFPALGPPTQDQNERIWGIDLHRPDPGVSPKVKGPEDLITGEDQEPWTEIMGYCVPEVSGFASQGHWISEHTYTEILEEVNDRFGDDGLFVASSSPGAVSVTKGASQQQEYLSVRGRIDRSEKTVEFRPTSQVTLPTGEYEIPEEGEYVLDALNQEGDVVESVPFVASRPIGPPDEINQDIVSFRVLVPADPNIEEVQVREGEINESDSKVQQENESILGSLTASPNAPSVTIESPDDGSVLSGDQTTIEWSGEDADGDEITYQVLYSGNGGESWQLLAASPEQTILSVDLEELSGSNEGIFRVQASDGFNVTEDRSTGITIPNSAPAAQIQLPSDGAQINESGILVLKGSASDPEDDQLGGSSLEWRSEEAGVLGTGENVNVQASELGEGTHTITLEATDSDGATDEATVTIEVTKPSAETIDQSPKLNDAIPDQGLPLSDSLKYGLGPVFEDPTGEGLTYSALSSDPGVVMPSTEKDTLLVEPVDEGTADVIVTAENAEGVARDTLEVEVTDFPPSAVTNFQIESVEDTPGEEEVALSWQPPKVGDLEGHHVYRSLSPVVDTSGAVRLTDSLTTDTSYVDSTVSSRKTYYYRVTAVDTSGNVSELSSEVRAFLYPDQVSANVSRSFGDASGPSDYRLVGLPGRANQPLAEAIEGEAGTDWQAYWDDGDEFVKFDGSDTFTFRKGRGFWLTSRDDWSVQTNFETVSLKSDTAAVIDLHDGWNIISNPTGKAVPFNAIQAAHPDTLQVFWPFGGAFNAPADTIQSARSGVAYYFNNTTGLDSLTLPYPDAPVTKNIAAADKSHEKRPSPLILSARPKGTRKQAASAVRFGFDPGATRGLDPQDLIAPPGRFEQVSLRIKSSTASKRERDPTLMSEWRPPISVTNEQDSGHTFRLRLASRTETPVSIEVKSFGDMQKRKVVLLYPQTGKTYDLRSNEQVTIDPEKKEAALKLAVGTNAYVESQKEKVVPNEVTVVSYPNPVQEQVTIEYTLPEAKKVRLAVYDVLGRRVAVLEDGRMEAGRHRVRLEAARLSSGIYFGRLRVGDQTRTQKITVVR